MQTLPRPTFSSICEHNPVNFATFATLFPLGATLAMAAFALELRLDLYQQCRHYRRPYPETANRLEAAELLLGFMNAKRIVDFFVAT